jgi:hypothetical protein
MVDGVARDAVDSLSRSKAPLKRAAIIDCAVVTLLSL